jgi:hypothetical protein
LLLLGLGGGLLLAFPEKVISQTKPYEATEIQFLGEPTPSDVSQLYEEWQLTQRAKKLVGSYGGPCVTFARNFTKASPEDVSGMARNVSTNTTTPEVGEIVKTNESRFGHLAVLISMSGNTGQVVEANYNWNGIIDIREIKFDDPKIVGYLNLN